MKSGEGAFRWKGVLISFAVLLCALSSLAIAQYTLKKSTFDMGGGRRSNSTMVCFNSVGQVAPIVDTSGIYTLRSGFLAGTSLSGIRPGDLSGDGILDVSDIVLMVAIILDTAEWNIVADMNSDYEINIFDVVTLLSIILQEESAQGPGPLELSDPVSVDLHSVLIENNRTRITIVLSQCRIVGGMELWLRYDRSLYSLENVRSLLDRTGFTTASSEKNGLIRILFYGTGDTSGQGDQPVCRIDLKSGEFLAALDPGIRIEKILLSDRSGRELPSLVSGVEEDGEISGAVPKEFLLHQNYPNPFNPSTTIVYDIPEEAGEVPVRISIYDIRGRLVRTLLEEDSRPGRYATHWDGESDRGERINSGVYFCRITAGKYVSTRKLVLTK